MPDIEVLSRFQLARRITVEWKERESQKGKEIPLVLWREFRMDIRLSHDET